MSSQREGIWTGKGGRLTRDRTLFRFGKRVEALHLVNKSTITQYVDVQVARDPTFYWPSSSPGPSHANETTVFQETYFYVSLAAGQTYDSPPFFARRGLKIKKVGTGAGNVWADAIVHGVSEGEIQNKDIS